MFCGDEDAATLDIYFDKVAKNGDLSTRQQRRGIFKTKRRTHGMWHSSDCKVMEEFVQSHLPMWLEERIIQQCQEHAINSRRSDKLSRVVGRIWWRRRDKRSVNLDGQDIFLSSCIYKWSVWLITQPYSKVFFIWIT